MSTTANLGMTLPAGTNWADIAVLNANFELIDAAMGAARTAEPYSAAKTYAVGDYCTRDGALFKCTVAITAPETWTAGHWKATSMGAEFKAIYAALEGKAAANHTHTAAQVGADASGAAAAVQANLDAHAARTDNPHGTTAKTIGAVDLVDKATDAEASDGSNDTKWMTPLKTSQRLSSALKFTEVFRSSTPGAYTYTATAGKTLLIAIIAGGGGGGGGGDNKPDGNGPGAGAGGGGGFLTITPIITVTAGTQIPIVVGAGGTHGVGGAYGSSSYGTTDRPSTAGSAGGTSSFLRYCAYGGLGGVNGRTRSPEMTSGGAKGGNGAFGYSEGSWIKASNGESSQSSLITFPYQTILAGGGGGGCGDYNLPGSGGTSDLGNGGAGGRGYYGTTQLVPTAGANGGIACGGGGGGCGYFSSSVPGANGGDGGPGLVVVYAMGV